MRKFFLTRMGRSVVFVLEGRLNGKGFEPSALWQGPKKLEVKIVGGPTVENIDLGELRSPGAYLTYDRKVLRIFHGIVRDEMFIKRHGDGNYK